jgi:hypothetical protein
MNDIYELIFTNMTLKELKRYICLNSEFYDIIYRLIYYKIKMSGFLRYLYNNTIFPKIKNNKIINVFNKKYRNRENEPIILFNNLNFI